MTTQPAIDQDVTDAANLLVWALNNADTIEDVKKLIDEPKYQSAEAKALAHKFIDCAKNAKPKAA